MQLAMTNAAGIYLGLIDFLKSHPKFKEIDLSKLNENNAYQRFSLCCNEIPTIDYQEILNNLVKGAPAYKISVKNGFTQNTVSMSIDHESQILEVYFDSRKP